MPKNSRLRQVAALLLVANISIAYAHANTSQTSENDLLVPSASPAKQHPTIDRAWTWYATAIKNHTPNRKDFDNFVRDYQAMYVDPYLASLRLKPEELHASQVEFQRRAKQYGDSLGLQPVSPPSPNGIQAEIRQEQKNLDGVLTSWVGSNINDFMMKWGAPSGEYRMPNGNSIYTWLNEDMIPTAVAISRVGAEYIEMGGGPIMVSCKITIFSDSRGTIFNWKWEGNGC
ncbi:hypothetical protein CS053_12380 [Rhodanobacter glycinis]|uniref:Uncharacterized protein n=1 Tax=Rhodanobacter glycinis TaxID=582702 RepID=A0A5B9E3R3_9GAMM|nr:hypothetical protein [Rhodanobacter glycinis]QEE25200.1 hypothetical protein CS053_12380 [Rhodanobacter glycinis]